MIRLLAALLVAGLGMPRMASAVRLIPEIRASGGWDSNVRNSNVREKSDLLGDLGGRFRLESERNAPLTWSLGYDGSYRAYRDSSDLDQYRQAATGEFRSVLAPATFLTGNARFEQTYDTGSGQFGTTTEQGAVTQRGRNDRIDRILASLALEHRLGPRWVGSLRASYNANHYNSSTRADEDAFGVVANLLRPLTPRQSVGFGLSVRRQNIDSTRISRGQTTDFANVFLTWNYALAPLWSLRSQIGPAFIRAEDQEDPILVVERDPGFVVAPVNLSTLDVDQAANEWVRETTFFSTAGCPSAGGQLVIVTTACLPTAPLVQRAPFLQAGTIQPAPPLPETGSVNALLLTNPGDQETENDSVTTFANISLVRRGELSSWSTTLSRREGSNLGGRTSTVLTTISSSLDWEPARHWELSLSGFFSKQESATDTSQVAAVFEPLDPADPPPGIDPGIPAGTAVRPLVDLPSGEPAGERRVVTLDNAVDIDTWQVSFRATRWFTRHLRGQFDVAYRNQDNNSQTATTASSFDDWRLGLSLIYRFDPISF